MKSARDRAEECLKQLNFPATPARIKRLENMLIEQNNATRNAADDAISCIRQDHDGMIDIVDAQRAVLNVKAV